MTLVARGPKPVAALRDMGLKPAIVAPEPNTWRELLAVTEGRPERRIAVQEYGRPTAELLDGAALARRGGDAGFVSTSGICRRMSSPCARRRAGWRRERFDVALFTTAIQMTHLARVARELGIEDAALANLRKCQVYSIGPTTTEALEEFGVHPSMEPSHPKMGFLVNEAAERATQ